MSLTAADSSGSGADQVLVDVWQLASMVEAQLAEALRTLTDADLEGADVVVQADREVNRLRYLIEERVTAELARGSTRTGSTSSSRSSTSSPTWSGSATTPRASPRWP